MDRHLFTSTLLVAALILPVGLAACNRSADTGSTSTPSTTPPTGSTVTNTAADNPNSVPATTTHTPGLPSVNGTDTSKMSTADAAAQRLIDNARNNLRDNDISKAKTLVGELKEKGMYDSLSTEQKGNVDQLEKDVNAAPPATNK